VQRMLKTRRVKSRGREKGWPRKLRVSNHRRILWDHNSTCCRSIEVLKDSPSRYFVPTPFGRSRQLVLTRRAAIAIVSQPLAIFARLPSLTQQKEKLLFFLVIYLNYTFGFFIIILLVTSYFFSYILFSCML